MNTPNEPRAHQQDLDTSLAFSSRCLPSSDAEIQERQRLEEFTQRKAEENRQKWAAAEERHQEYQAFYEANKERLDREEAARAARRNGKWKR